MRYAHLLSRITSTPWFITDDALEAISALLEQRIWGASGLPVEKAEAIESPAAAQGTAVIPIRGVIGKRLSAMEMACGGADIGAIEAAFDAANNDASVSRIVMHVDSPGGTVTGVPELAQKIYNEKRKSVVAVTDTVMASAAYYIASAADEIVATPTANVGSIGVVAMVRETMDPKAADGRTRLRVFRSGKDKLAGSDGPLGEEQAAAIQARVDELGDMFRGDVLKARPGIAADSMTGLVFHGEEARSRHLVDRVVRSLSEVL